MKKNLFFVTVLFSLLFIVSCGFYDDTEIKLTKWEYSIDQLHAIYNPIDNSQFTKLAKVCNGRKGDIYLKTSFMVPKELKGQRLKIFLGNVKIANEFYLNGVYIDHNGTFGDIPFSNGSKASAYILPPALYDDNKRNEIIIHVQDRKSTRLNSSH